jgi:hypothetical protein
MKVKVEITLDVNEEDWALDYGVEPGQVRADVKEHSRQLLLAHYGGLGLLNGGPF